MLVAAAGLGALVVAVAVSPQLRFALEELGLRLRDLLASTFGGLFDLRYHVASLAAVFLALIIGILVVPASRPARTSRAASGACSRTGSRSSSSATRTSSRRPTCFGGSARRRGLRRQHVSGADERAAPRQAVALLFTGQPDDSALDAVEQTLQDASGPAVVEREAFELPIDPEQVMDLDPQFQGLTMEEVGRRLGEELVEGRRPSGTR